MAGLQINERIWQITCNDNPVDHLFDAKGSETFDVTQAVEVCVHDYGLRRILENDVFTFTLLMGLDNG